MLAKDGPYYNLDVPISEAIAERPDVLLLIQDYTGIHSCSPDDTLGHLLEAIQSSPVRRFVVLEAKVLVGVISLSDILKFML
jgi:CBS domain-containing protein